MTITPLLAHAGEGAAWQSLVVAAALGLMVAGVLAIVGRLRIDSFDDLVLPFASIAIASALAPVFSEVLSDWVGWALPVGAVLLLALVVAAATPLQFRPTSPLTTISVGVAIIAAVLLHRPLTDALHPEPDRLAFAEDAEVAILTPPEEVDVDAGDVQVIVGVSGGAIGPAGLAPERAGDDDPLRAGTLLVELNGQRQQVTYDETCTVERPCSIVTFHLDVPPGDHLLRVEFTRADGAPFAPTVVDRRAFSTG